jgi:hypothetical protein
MRIRILGTLLAAMLATGAAAQSGSQANFDRMMSHDGLRPVQVKGVSLAYKRPEATLAGYKRVAIEPVQVAFAKDWKPMQSGSRIPLSAAAREDIRTGLAKVVRDQFEKALVAQGRYPVVSGAGPDVLRLRINIANLYVNAPEGASGASPSYNFSMSAGEMTLFLELFDSESGQILARVVDRQEGRSPNIARMAGQVSNVAAAEGIAAEWARILRDAFDRAHGAAPPPKK